MKKIEGYLSIGKDFIEPEKFIPVVNSENQKPHGGFWATKHDLNSICYNDWMDYLTEQPHLIYYKYPDKYPIPAVFFTLKKEATILIVEHPGQYETLKRVHPGINNSIDFEELSRDCDGIFINKSALSEEELKDFSVSSLLLFNLDCIEEYRQADVFVEVDHKHGFALYEYNIVPKRKKYTIENGPILTRQKKDVK